MLRYLRIAASALSLATCLTLAILWTRGPWERTCHARMKPTPQRLRVGSTGALLGFSVEARWFSGAEFMPIRPHPYYHEAPLPTKLGFYYWKDDYSYGFFAPFWLLMLLSLTSAAAPWFRWRFSLRTALAATTLIAAALG